MTNRKIIGVIRPFDAKQLLMVYEDGNKIDYAETNIDELNNTLFTLAEKYEVTQFDMTGPKKYLKGLENRIKEAEIAKYTTNKLIINII